MGNYVWAWVLALLVAVIIVVPGLWYLTRNKSQKYYIKSIVKQIPYLRARYRV